MCARLLLLSCLLACGEAFAWGAQGHQVSGAIADQLLEPNASQRVQEILGGMSLQVASTWADCVKDVSHSDGGFVYKPDPRFHASCQFFETSEGIVRMEDYVARNWDNCQPEAGADPCHKQYHYTDVAIQHNHYEMGFAGTSDHDVVAAINATIAVLQGQPAPAPFSIKDQKEALLMLAHLVGDVHQPLHVGAIYLDSHDHRTNPDAAGHHLDPKTETRGGNSIKDGSTNLHSEWDTISTSLKPDHITATMLNNAKAVNPAAGDVSTWATVFASDTVVVSHTAFKGITYTHTGTTKVTWTGHFSDRTAYLATKRNIQATQLTKAGAHLAQILNAIWP